MKPNVRVVPIAQLVLDEKNANKGTKRGRQLLGKALEKYGGCKATHCSRGETLCGAEEAKQIGAEDASATMQGIAASLKSQRSTTLRGCNRDQNLNPKIRVEGFSAWLRRRGYAGRWE